MPRPTPLAAGDRMPRTDSRLDYLEALDFEALLSPWKIHERTLGAPHDYGESPRRATAESPGSLVGSPSGLTRVPQSGCFERVEP